MEENMADSLSLNTNNINGDIALEIWNKEREDLLRKRK